MAIAIKRILLVTRDVQFAIDSKRGLEALGEYAVTTVTEARNAIEQLRHKPHHLVLVDIENLAIAPSVMIEMIHARQGEIAIVLAPDRPEAHDLSEQFRAQGVVDIPAPSRSLIPVLEEALRAVYEALPETAKSPAVDLHDDTVEIESLVDDAVGDDAHPSYTLQRLQASYRLLHPEAEAVPSAAALDAVELVIEQKDGETIRYHRVGKAREAANESRADSTNSVEEDMPLNAEPGESTVLDLAQALSKSTADTVDQVTTVEASAQPAGNVLGPALKVALGDDAPIDELSLLTLYEDIRGESPTDYPDRPAWMKERARFVDEPQFLQEWLPKLDSQVAQERTTVPTILALENDGGAADTTMAAGRATADADLNGTPADALLPLRSYHKDPYIDQLAVTISQMLAELTAEATVLSRDRKMLAFSGGMDLDEIMALRAAINDDWSAQQDRARLRFLAVPDSGRDYMLFSKATINGLTLSMIFAGDKALSAISEQGDRMLGALADLGEGGDPRSDGELPLDAGEQDETAAPESPMAKLPYAFVWLTADPDIQFSESVAGQLVFWLEVQLNGLGWALRRLDVHQDFVYLLADIPMTESPDQLMQGLMARSGRIARSEDSGLPENLWADAYLVLQPGRELDSRELRGFLQFARSKD